MEHLIDGDRLTIDCGTCAMGGTSACDDCLVTFVCDTEPGGALVLDLEEARIARQLQEAGMLPSVRYARR